MKNIVITGSTRGLGFGLADSFLSLDCQVVISGRTQASVDRAVGILASRHPSERIFAQPCEVTALEQVERLWSESKRRFGAIDIWINNAGRGHPPVPMWELDPDAIQSVVDTDLVGLIYGCRVAIRGMLEQGHGQLYNMEGFGSRGRTMGGLSVYGAVKSGVRSLTETLVKEAAGTPVQVCSISPGMLVTELITDQYPDDPEGLERVKRILNILGDRVETVTPWLAKRILENNRSGARIAWLTRGKIFMRFLTAPFNKRDLFN